MKLYRNFAELGARVNVRVNGGVRRVLQLTPFRLKFVDAGPALLFCPRLVDDQIQEFRALCSMSQQWSDLVKGVFSIQYS